MVLDDEATTDMQKQHEMNEPPLHRGNHGAVNTATTPHPLFTKREPTAVGLSGKTDERKLPS